MRFESSTDVNAPVEMAWGAIKDPEQWPRWVPSIRSVEKLFEGPLGVGSRLSIKVRAVIPIGLLMTVTEFIPARRVVMQGKILWHPTVRFYALEPRGPTARLAAGGEVSGPLAWLICRNGRSLSKKIVVDLKRRIEDSGG